MLIKSSLFGCLRKNCLSKSIRCLSEITSEESKQISLDETFNSIEEKKKCISVSFTSLSDDDLQEIKEFETAAIDVTMVAHQEYVNYCRKDPENIITMENQYDKLNELLSPFMHITDYYAQQRMNRGIFIKPLINLKISMEQAQCYFRAPTKGPKYMCPVENIRYMMKREEYRNISELSVSKGVDGEYNTVGYLLKNYETEEQLCVNPIHHPDTKKTHKAISVLFQDFIQKYSVEFNDKPWRVWKGITIRSSEYTKNHMAVVKVAYCITTQERERMKDALCKLFFLGDLKKYCNVSSLYIQYGNNKRNLELVKGAADLMEMVKGHKYVIRPYTIFPANSVATTLLVDAIKGAYEIDKSTVVLQVGCHSYFGMQLSKKARNVICMDWRPSMLAEAKLHAKINNIPNIEFLALKNYEDITKSLDDRAATFVAVVHSVNGFNKRVLYRLRQSPSVKAIIYIFHDFAYTRSDILTLCSNIIPDFHHCETLPPERFGPANVIPLDMLPNTTNTDFVMVLKRESLLKKKKKVDIDPNEFYSFQKQHSLHEAFKEDRGLNIDEIYEDEE